MDRNEIGKRLQGVPGELCAAFATRAALRVLPFLVSNKDPKRIALWYWKQDDQPRFLLAVLRAQAGAVFTCLRGQVSFDLYSAAREADAAAYAAYAAAYVATAAAYSAFSHGAYAAADAAIAAAYATAKNIPNIAKEIEADLSKITSENLPTAIQLINSPLFQQITKDDLQQWQVLWKKFSDVARTLNVGFDIWSLWYEARVRGDAITFEDARIWVEYPKEVEAQGPAAINAYIASQVKRKATQPLNRVRTIFIGYGEAGKTSLIRALHGEEVVQGNEAMTPGIEIREWMGAGGGLTTHFWDFGGQVVAHATHQFFLRSSCLYVLVLSARAEINANEQAEYWLQHVQTYGDSAPVMIVGNKCDQASLHVDMASLKAKYANVVDFFPISCTQAKKGPHQTKFDAFRATFCEQLALVGTRQVMFSPAQFKVLQAVQELSAAHSFLPRDEFEQLCEQHKVSNEGVLNRAWLLDILDKLGIIIHFPQMQLTDDYVLNPRWLTYGVYTVMYGEQPYVSESSVHAMLSKEKIFDEKGRQLAYTYSKCRVIVDAMQRFKLCYPKPDAAGEMIIPGLLPTDMPDNIKDIAQLKAKSLAYKVKFSSFLPRHIMPQMIVEHHPDIITKMVWQNGVGLENETLRARAILQVDYQLREIGVWVQDTGARDYLAVLRSDLLAILKKVKLEFTELIRLPSKALRDGMPELHKEDWADFNQVEEHLRQGMPKFISSQGVVYDLGQLRGQVFPKNYQIIVHGDANFIQGEVENMSKQTITISGGTVNGSVIAAEKMEDVHINNQINISEKEQIAQKIFKEINALQLPPEKQADKEYLLGKANSLLVESKKNQPVLREVTNNLKEMNSVLGEVGLAVPVVTGLLAQAATLFGIGG